jgi:hypothetical protein
MTIYLHSPKCTHSRQRDNFPIATFPNSLNTTAEVFLAGLVQTHTSMGSYTKKCIGLTPCNLKLKSLNYA